MPGRRTAGADGRDVDRLPAQLRKGQARGVIAARPDEAGDGAGATFSRRRARGATIAENGVRLEQGTPHPVSPWTFLRRGRGGLSCPPRPDAAACGGAGEDAVFAGRARQRDPFAGAAERGREPVEPAGDIGAEMIMVVIPNAHELLVFHRSFPFAWVQPRCAFPRFAANKRRGPYHKNIERPTCRD